MPIRARRGTKAQVDTAAAANALKVGEMMLLTDVSKFAVATAVNDYEEIGPADRPSIIRSARTSNTILAATDNATIIDITSGTFTQTFSTAATLASGWFCYIRNSGTGDITLDPDGSETIDGLTSFIMYPGECRLVTCDGTAFRSIVLKSFSRTFTASGTFTTPPGYRQFAGRLWGAGGGGAGGAAWSSGGGGGACTPFELPSSTFGATETVTIGAGGTAGPLASNGGVGGDSTVGTIVESKGGGAGVYGGGASVAGGSGGSAGANGYALPSGLSAGGMYAGGASTSGGSNPGYYGGGSGGAANSPAGGGASVFGGGGGGGTSSSTPYLGGTSSVGGNGGAAATTTNGNPGSAPGGGGGGGSTTTTGRLGGAGARGELRIWGVL